MTNPTSINQPNLQKPQLIALCPSRNSAFEETKLVKNVFCKPISQSDMKKKTLMTSVVSTYDIDLPHIHCAHSAVDYYDSIEETRCIAVAPSEHKGLATHTHQRVVSKVLDWRNKEDIEEDITYNPALVEGLMNLPSITIDTIRESKNSQALSGMNRITYLLEDGTGYKVPRLNTGVTGSYLRTKRDAELTSMLYSSPNYYGGQLKEYIPELVRVEVDSKTSLYGLKFKQFKNATTLTRDDTLPSSAIEKIKKAGFTPVDKHSANFVKITLNDDQECYVLIDAKHLSVDKKK